MNGQTPANTRMIPPPASAPPPPPPSGRLLVAQEVSGELLTDSERSIVTDIGYVWARLHEIVGDGPSRQADLREAATHIHALQNMVLSQAAARAYRHEFRLLGEVLPDGLWKSDIPDGSETAVAENPG